MGLVRKWSWGRVEFFFCFMQPPCFTLQKELLYHSCVFFEDLLPFVFVCDPILSGARVAPTSQVRASAILVLPIVGN
jgi:hypothetical protein